MNRTVWKPEEEIRFSLERAERVTILACTVCANLSFAGGRRGAEHLRSLVEGWGKEVKAAGCVTACCAEEVMRQAVARYGRALDSSDALVVLSCAAGIKSANLASPGIPVIAVTDPVGSTPVSRRDDPVARSLCTSCGQCVISFTGGICPLSECPARSKYGPCKKRSRPDGPCVLDESRDCVWTEIERRGDLAALDELRRVHENPGVRTSPLSRGRSPALLRKTSGWLVAHAGWFGRLVDTID